MGVYGSVWGCMGVYGEAAAAATHNVASLCGNVSQKSQSFPKSPKPSQKKPPSTILPAYAAKKKAAAKNAAAFEYFQNSFTCCAPTQRQSSSLRGVFPAGTSSGR